MIGNDGWGQERSNMESWTCNRFCFKGIDVSCVNIPNFPGRRRLIHVDSWYKMDTCKVIVVTFRFNYRLYLKTNVVPRNFSSTESIRVLFKRPECGSVAVSRVI